MEFVCDNIPFEYPHILQTILEDGEKTSPRGFETVEIRGITICSKSPTKRFVNHPNRHAHPIFPIIELFWYLSGDDSPQTIKRYIPAIARYVNSSTGRFDGAYGPRLRRYGGRVDQLEHVFRRLKFDNASRRALVTLYDPLLDNNDSSLDVPCNISLQFMVRNGKLELNTYARSQDMIRGFIYDTAEWQLLQDILAGWLGVELGVFRLFVGSAHIYVSDLAKAQRIANLDSKFDLYQGLSPQRASCPRNQFDSLMHTYAELESIIQQASDSGGSLATKDEAIESLLGPVTNRFWRNAFYAIISYNAFKNGATGIADGYLERIDNELRIALSIWRQGRVTSGRMATSVPEK